MNFNGEGHGKLPFRGRVIAQETLHHMRKGSLEHGVGLVCAPSIRNAESRVRES